MDITSLPIHILRQGHEARANLLPSKFFQFHAVFEKICQNCMLALPSPGVFAPPPRGNPRSAMEPIHKQECIPVGCIPPTCCPYLPACTALRGVPALGGCTCPGGVLAQRGVPARGCTCPGGVPAQGGYLPRYSLPPLNRKTNRCKNITELSTTLL